MQKFQFSAKIKKMIAMAVIVSVIIVLLILLFLFMKENQYKPKGENMPRSLKKEISASLEDYLETIYEIFEEKQGVKAIEISRRLGIGRSSVTDALKTLAEKKLVNYGRYDVISLTKDGEKAAKDVIKKHHILSSFFTQILGLSEEEANKNACRIEHVISEDAFQGFVRFMKENSQQ